MILRDRKMVKDCKKKYSEFTKKLIQVLAEKGVDYTIEKDECRSEAEIVKISYEDKKYQAEVFAKEKVVFFEKESYKTTDKTVNDIINLIGCENSGCGRIYSGVSREYGSDSEKIYIKLCKEYCWKAEQPKIFDRHGGLLYAKQQKNSDRRGVRLYAETIPLVGYVWFLSHSNWTASKGDSWEITISKDKNLIEEIFKRKKEDLFDDGVQRVVFAKKKNGQYVFLGIYITEDFDYFKEDKDRGGKKFGEKHIEKYRIHIYRLFSNLL